MQILYSHRNGETEPPRGIGLYWFRGKIHHPDFYHTVADSIELGNRYTTGEIYYDGEECGHVMSDFEGEWWGPIVAPWDEATQPYELPTPIVS